MSQQSLRLNRKEELKIFAKMLTGEIPDRILLIHAEGGMGKTHLLKEFISQCKSKTLSATIDFKGGGISLPEFLSRLCDSLGWEKFKNLSTFIRRSATHQTSSNVTGNTLLGHNQIIIEQILSAPDENTRERQQVTITDTFFEDLRLFPQVALIFDTYNDCDPIVAAWLSSAFLARACHSKNIVVVIAGRQIPEASLEWDALCHELVLRGIESKYFEEYALSEGIQVHPERIRGLCDAFGGRPLPILNQIKAYALQERRS